VAESESIAAAIGGLAVSNSEATADGIYFGHARSRSTSTALSRWGTATSDSRARSLGYYGGRARSDSDSAAVTFGGHAASTTYVDSDARYYADARANGVGLSSSGVLRWANSRVRAESRAVHGSRSDANVVGIEIRP